MWKGKTKEEVAAYNRAYQNANREELKKQRREYWQRNRERLLQKQREYYQNNREKFFANAKEWRRNNPEKAREVIKRSAAKTRARLKAEQPELVKERNRVQTLRHFSDPSLRMKRILIKTNKRSKTEGIPIDPDLKPYLMSQIPKTCACCGQDINYTDTGRQDLGPSIDRVDNTKGYTKDNVCIICYRCNMVKGRGSPAELENVVAYVRRFIESRDSQTLCNITLTTTPASAVKTPVNLTESL